MRRSVFSGRPKKWSVPSVRTRRRRSFCRPRSRYDDATGILDKTAQRLDTELKDQPEAEADLRRTLGVVYYDLGGVLGSGDHAPKGPGHRTRALGNEHPIVATRLTLWDGVSEEHANCRAESFVIGKRGHSEKASRPRTPRCGRISPQLGNRSVRPAPPSEAERCCGRAHHSRKIPRRRRRTWCGLL